MQRAMAKDRAATHRRLGPLLTGLVCFLVIPHADAFAEQNAGEAARKALLVGLARAGTKSVAEATAFLESEGAKAAGLGKEVGAIRRRLKEAAFVEELAEIGLGSTRGLVRVRSGDGAFAGRFVGIEDGFLKLRTSMGKTVTVKTAGLDAESFVRYSGVADTKTGDPAKAANYYLMRGDPAAARRALGELEDDRARELRAAIDELSGLLEQARPVAAREAEKRVPPQHPSITAEPIMGDVALPPPTVQGRREAAKLRSPDPDVRGKAVDTIAFLRDWGMIPAVAEAFRNADEGQRGKLVCFLQPLRHPWAMSCLRDIAAHDPAEGVRVRAVRALESQGAWAAVPDLLDYLANDRSVKVRIAAAGELYKWRLPAAVKGLISAMDGEPDVRAAAANSLGSLADEKAVPVLVGNLKHRDIDVRSACAKALGSIGGEMATRALMMGLRREPLERRNCFVISRIVDALAEIGADVTAPEIRRLAGHPHSGVRRSVALALGSLGDTDSVGDLTRMLKDRSPGMRSAAKTALANIGTWRALKVLDSNVPRERSFESLVRKLKSGTPEERGNAAGDLDAYKSSAAISALVAALDDAHPSVRGSALTCLAKNNRRWCYPAVMRLTEAANAYVRRKAVEAVGSLKDPRAVPVLLKILEEDASAAVRAAAARALRWSRDPSAIPALTRALADDIEVRRSAVISLGDLHAREASAQIMGCLASKDEELRAVSAVALRSLGRRAAIPALLGALRKEAPELARSKSAEWIIHALGGLQAHFAAEEIARFIRSPDRLVRSSVVSALGRIGTEEVVPMLAIALEDESSGIRKETARHLENIATPEALQALRDAGK